MPLEIEDIKIIQQYISGDEKSLEILIAKYLKQIYNFVYRNVGSQADAEDITQEVFVKVWKNIRKFDQKKNFKPWVYQIAKNASIDFLRKKKTIPFSKFENENGQNMIIDTMADHEAENLVENLSDKRVVESIMAGLPEKDRRIIDLRHNQGMSFKQISENMQEPINTVKSRYRRIIFGLRKNVRT